MLTRSKLDQLHDDRLDRVMLGAAVPRRPIRRWLFDPGVVASRWSFCIGAGWWMSMQVYLALIPAAAEPEAATPLWAVLATMGFGAMLLAMAVGLGTRARIGLVLSMVAGGLFLLNTVMCPVSGHHESVGAWWYLGLASFSGVVLASAAALRRSRPPVGGGPAGA